MINNHFKQNTRKKLTKLLNTLCILLGRAENKTKEIKNKDMEFLFKFTMSNLIQSFKDIHAALRFIVIFAQRTNKHLLLYTIQEYI